MLRTGVALWVVLGLVASLGCSGSDDPVGSRGAEDAGGSPRDDDDDDDDDDAEQSDGVAPEPSSSDDGAGGAPATPSGTTAPTGSVTTPTPTSTASTPPAIVLDPSLSNIGGPCQQDGHCQVGLTCMQEDTFFSPDNEGTIAGGLCTARCEEAPGLCDEYGGAATCILSSRGTEDTADDIGICLEMCQGGDGMLKCQGNPDQLCVPLDATLAGVCAPSCLDDVGCANGQFCDPIGGLSMNDAPAGKAYGEACSGGEECVGGGCIYLTEESQGLCSGECNFINRVADCGFVFPEEGETVAPPDSYCIPAAENLGIGDPGICIPLCDTDEDCQLDTLHCEPLGDPEFTAAVGREGFCLPNDATPAPVEGMPDAGADNMDNADASVQEPTAEEPTEPAPEPANTDAGAAGGSPAL
jgi:hypothetical protein